MKQPFRVPQKESGQGLVEYALILVLVALALILILTLFGSTIITAYAKIIGSMNGQTISGSGDEFIILGIDGSATASGPNCQLNHSKVTAVILDDGKLVEQGSHELHLTVNGSATKEVDVTIGSSGIAEGSLNVTALCPLTLTAANGYKGTFAP